MSLGLVLLVSRSKLIEGEQKQGINIRIRPPLIEKAYEIN